MIKSYVVRKVSVASCALVILFMIYLFPKTSDSINIEKNIVYKDNEESFVYMLDENDYLSKVNINISEKEVLNIIKEKINILLNSGNINGFISPFAKSTVLIDVSLNSSILKLNFSKELLLSEDEESIIESLIYTCIDDTIKGIEIYVEDKLLTVLPSGKKLDYPLDKSYGINKKYDITTLNDIDKVTIYYVGKNDDEIYYIPVTHVINTSTEKINIIIDELKSSVLYQSNLSSYLNSNAVLKDYEIIEETMFLTFNNKIFDDFDSKNILEEVKYTLKESIMENYDVSEVVIKVE